jgi:hypothetical protein
MNCQQNSRKAQLRTPRYQIQQIVVLANKKMQEKERNTELYILVANFRFFSYLNSSTLAVSGKCT